MMNWNRRLGIFLILMATIVWAVPGRELARLQAEEWPADQFQLLAFPTADCANAQCPSRAANASILEWRSGTLKLVQSEKDLKFPSSMFTLTPPHNAEEMVNRWRAELRHQGFDNGDLRVKGLKGGGWQMELEMRDDVHSRMNRFLYEVTPDGNPVPGRVVEYSWLDKFLKCASVVILLMLGFLLLLLSRAKSK